MSRIDTPKPFAQGGGRPASPSPGSPGPSTAAIERSRSGSTAARGARPRLADVGHDRHLAPVASRVGRTPRRATTVEVRATDAGGEHPDRATGPRRSRTARPVGTDRRHGHLTAATERRSRLRDAHAGAACPTDGSRRPFRNRKRTSMTLFHQRHASATSQRSPHSRSSRLPAAATTHRSPPPPTCRHGLDDARAPPMRCRGTVRRRLRRGTGKRRRQLRRHGQGPGRHGRIEQPRRCRRW